MRLIDADKIRYSDMLTMAGEIIKGWEAERGADK